MAKVNVTFSSAREHTPVLLLKEMNVSADHNVAAVVVEVTVPEGRGIATITPDADIRIAPAGQTLSATVGHKLMAYQQVSIGVHPGQILRMIEAE